MKGTELDIAIWRLWLFFSGVPPAVISAGMSGVVAWLVSSYNYRRNVRPVLIFTKRNHNSWYLENVGSGPAIDVLLSDCRTKGGWDSPTRYHSIGVKDKAEILSTRAGDSFAVSYSDVNGRWYSTTCIDSQTTIHNKSTFRDWKPVFTEHDLMAQRKGTLDVTDVMRRSATRVMDQE